MTLLGTLQIGPLPDRKVPKTVGYGPRGRFP